MTKTIQIMVAIFLVGMVLMMIWITRIAETQRRELYDMGFKDAELGVPAEGCPFDKEWSGKRLEWFNGWLDGKAQR